MASPVNALTHQSTIDVNQVFDENYVYNIAVEATQWNATSRGVPEESD
jgi:hypothetical protein